MKRKTQKTDPLLILALIVGLGVVASTLTQRLSSDQPATQAVSKSSTTIKNDTQSLDPNILVKVNETRQRKPANSSEDSKTTDPEKVRQTTVYQF